MKTKPCSYCGEQFEYSGRIDTAFCTVEHRTKYNNEKRRIKALYNKAMKAINELEEIAANSRNFANQASLTIHKIHNG